VEEMKGIQSMSLKEKVLCKVQKSPEGCWLWQGCLLKDGYAMLRYKAKKILVHRAAWTAFNGDIKPGLLVLHKCDVRHCCNPDHLFLGTHADNTLDAVNKGRQKNMFPAGAAHPKKKIKEAYSLV
jgi:hypothetical protein